MDAPPKKSRLPFKRAQRKPSPPPEESTKKDTDEDESLEFFRRAKEDFPEMVQEKEKLVKTQARKSSDAKRRSPEESDIRKRRKVSLDSSDESDTAHGPRSGSSRKRESTTTPQSSTSLTSPVRRLANESDDDEIIMDVKGKGKEIIPNGSSGMGTMPVRSTLTGRSRVLDDDDAEEPLTPFRGGRNQRTARSSRQKRDETPPLRTYDDEEDDEDLAFTSRRRNSSVMKVAEKEVEAIEDDAEEDEFDEYVQAAKARMERAKVQEASAVKEDSATPVSEDRIIKLMIVSRIPGAKMLVFKRKVSQTMEVVIQTWILSQRQNNVDIPIEAENTLFLTWNGNKVYATTSPAALGIRLDSTGEVIRHPGDNPAAYDSGGLLLEMWTEDLYKESQKQKERERLIALGQLEDVESEDDLVEMTSQPQKEQKKVGIKVIMRSNVKEFGELKLMAQNETTVETMIDLFRARNEVPEDKTITLMWEGEVMDPSWQVNDFDEIDHKELNQFDVLIKDRVVED